MVLPRFSQGSKNLSFMNISIQLLNGKLKAPSDVCDVCEGLPDFPASDLRPREVIIKDINQQVSSLSQRGTIDG